MFLGSLLEKINPFAKQSIKLEKLPISTADRSNTEQEEQFIQKIRLCCNTFDFKDATTNIIGKKTKLATLKEVLKHVDERQGMLPDSVYVEIVKMVSCNIIRTFPPNTLAYFNPDVDDPQLEASWPHLEVVYNVFLSVLDSQDFKPITVKAIIDRKFVLHLLMLLNSADPRERGFLKWVILRIYSKFYSFRGYIRTQIYNIFYQFIYIVEDFNGIGELLWVLTTILGSCFTSSLKAEHDEYLEKILMPLHKVKCLSTFHSQLEQSVIQFIMKDAHYIVQIVRGLIKFWPKTSTQKEILFLDEIEDYIKGIAQSEFVAIQKPLLTQIAKCVGSAHMEVAEHSLNILNNKHMMSLIKPNSAVVMPIICPALLSISKGHWNQTVLKRAYTALQLFVEINAELFDELLAKYADEKEKVKQRQHDRDLAWKKVQELIAKRYKTKIEFLPLTKSPNEGNIINLEH